MSFVSALTLSMGAQAAPIAFEWNEGGPGNGSLSLYSSHHAAAGPVLADDFISAVSGAVSSVTWWGGAPISGASNNDNWELTFHAHDAINNTPAFTLPGGGLSQHFATVAGTDADGDGVYQYTTTWAPQDLTLSLGTQYWFSVANATGAGWLWADAIPGGPQVGSESVFAHQSVGGTPSLIPGPHDGPWSQVACPLCGRPTPTNLAFRVSAVPLPASLPMLAIGLGGLAGFARRRRRRRWSGAEAS